MNWSSCYSGSNNIHFESPPIMNDGRNYAQWQPGAEINEKIRKDLDIKTNWQYRKYLQNNADKIIKLNQSEACNYCCDCPYYHSVKTSNNPYLFTSCTESTQPYGYEKSDLKSLYLSRYELQSRICLLYTSPSPRD